MEWECDSQKIGSETKGVSANTMHGCIDELKLNHLMCIMLFFLLKKSPFCDHLFM